MHPLVRRGLRWLAVVAGLFALGQAGAWWWHGQVRKAVALEEAKRKAEAARDSLRAVVHVRDSVTGAALELAGREHQAAQAQAAKAQQANHDAASAKARADSLGHVADSLAALASDTTHPDFAPGDTLRPFNWEPAYQARTRQQMATAASLAAKTAESEALTQAVARETARADGLAASLEVTRADGVKTGQALADSTQALGTVRAELAGRGCHVNLGLVRPSCGLVVGAAVLAGVKIGLSLRR